MAIKDDLLDAAETLVRTGGYNNFSFRDLAEQVGIKSASVHYHYKTKADLALALIERYTERFIAELSQRQQVAEADAGQQMTAAFRDSLQSSGMMCLCGMLAAEGDGLPAEVKLATASFFKRNQSWLSQQWQAQHQLRPELAERRALALLAMLEGALLLAKVGDDLNLFDVVVSELQVSQS